MTQQLTEDQIDGKQVVGSDGAKIGKVQEIYFDDETGSPEWVSVKTGMFGSKAAFIPLSAARVDGDDIVVPFDKEQVKGSPHHEDDGELSVDDEAELFDYYAIPYEGETVTAAGPPQGTPTAEAARPSGDAMTRSEEQLHVGKRTVETGKVRLRKRIVTENVTKTVPVTHEEVVVEREPITDANRADATSGPDLTEDEAVVTLHGEEAVVSKETVPVEQVSLGTEQVTGEQTIDADVSREEIDVDR